MMEFCPDLVSKYAYIFIGCLLCNCARKPFLYRELKWKKYMDDIRNDVY